MRHGSSALRLMALLVGVAATAAAQKQPKPQGLPDASVAKRESAEFAGRLWPGNGWIWKTFRHFDGYGGIDEFFRNVCNFVRVAPRPALLRDAARRVRASRGVRAEPHRGGANG